MKESIRSGNSILRNWSPSRRTRKATASSTMTSTITTFTYITGDYLFDFGDVSYHWFAYDIAIAIYHAVQTVPENWKAEFVARFFDSFYPATFKRIR